MRYEGQIYRPPSEADAYILQATIGCSWNHCTYCDMYRDKSFRVRDLDETLEDIRTAGRSFGGNVTKVFVADGDALVLDLEHWEAILAACRDVFPQLKRVSAYATAINLNKKSPAELKRLRKLGLSLLYMGPETGDDVTFKRIAKGSNFEEHVQAAKRAHDAGIKVSAIFLLGAGGTERTEEHAEGSAKLITEMNPEFVSALTLTIIPGTPIAKMQAQGRFTLPSVTRMLEELRTIVSQAAPTDAVFRTNHASNYLPLAGRLPQDRERIVEILDKALAGDIPLRPERSRGL
ncbi:MAG: radical SAM protein [Deltaproteobacteria bacterium]|nr:radical SAM protein [Deltaproteobacteria bacterium]